MTEASIWYLYLDEGVLSIRNSHHLLWDHHFSPGQRASGPSALDSAVVSRTLATMAETQNSGSGQQHSSIEWPELYHLWTVFVSSSVFSSSNPNGKTFMLRSPHFYPMGVTYLWFHSLYRVGPGLYTSSVAPIIGSAIGYIGLVL